MGAVTRCMYLIIYLSGLFIFIVDTSLLHAAVHYQKSYISVFYLVFSFTYSFIFYNAIIQLFLNDKLPRSVLALRKIIAESSSYLLLNTQIYNFHFSV